MSDDFDYGVDPNELGGGGSTFKNPEVGDHNAVLRSLIQCGNFREEYKGERKPVAPQVVAIFELKGEENYEEDGITPLTLEKTFPLKKGDKAFLTKFRKTLDPKGECKNFAQMIGKPCTVTARGSKAVGEDGKPKYINFGGMSGLTTNKQMLAFMESNGLLTLEQEGVGFVKFDEMTKEAILELNPILHVADIIMKGENYEGSKAQEIIEEIRKENHDFAKRKPKDDEGSEEGSSSSSEETPPPPPPCDMDESQEF